MRHIVLSVCAVCLLAACNTADKQGIATSVVKGADGNELTVEAERTGGGLPDSPFRG